MGDEPVAILELLEESPHELAPNARSPLRALNDDTDLDEVFASCEIEEPDDGFVAAGDEGAVRGLREPLEKPFGGRFARGAEAFVPIVGTPAPHEARDVVPRGVQGLDVRYHEVPLKRAR